jgi:hypothetical protein
LYAPRRQRRVAESSLKTAKRQGSRAQRAAGRRQPEKRGQSAAAAYCRLCATVRKTCFDSGAIAAWFYLKMSTWQNAESSLKTPIRFSGCF